MRGRGWIGLGAVLVLVLGAARVHAQVCGDADGSGTVTVTDGVQTLRGAALLPSICTAAACDVDGSGTITVTDGVNVLRKAANLPSADQCSGTAGQIEGLVGQVTATLNLGLAFLPGGVADAAFTEACSDGGSYEAIDEGNGGATFVYTNCLFGPTRLNGSISSRNGTAAYGQFEVVDTTTGNTTRLNGQLTSLVDTNAGRVTFDGSLTVFSSLFGETTFIYRNLVNTFEGAIVAGQVLTSLAAAGAIGVDTVEITFDESTTAAVRVTFEDGATTDYLLDRPTGKLTPVVAGASGTDAPRLMRAVRTAPGSPIALREASWIRTRSS